MGIRFPRVAGVQYEGITDCHTGVRAGAAMTFLGSAVHVERRALLASLTMNFCRDRADLDTLLIFIIFL